MKRHGLKIGMFAIAMLFLAIASIVPQGISPSSLDKQYIHASNGELEDFESYEEGADIAGGQWQVASIIGGYFRCAVVSGDKYGHLHDGDDHALMWAWFGLPVPIMNPGEWVEISFHVTSIVSNEFQIRFADPDDASFAYMTVNADGSWRFFTNQTDVYGWSAGVEVKVRITVIDESVLSYSVNGGAPIIRGTFDAVFGNSLAWVCFESMVDYDDYDLMIRYIDSGDGVTDIIPDAAFSANVTSINEGQSILFNHTGSIGDPPATYQWNFGDGTANATAENATHQYSVAGTYDVTLTVTDIDSDVDVEKKIGYITVAEVLPDAAFSANTTSISEGNSVLFTHTGSNGNAPAAYQWNFGDGTGNATLENPTHQYTVAGTYDVTLTVMDTDSDIDVEKKIDYITVTEVLPDAAFSANVTSIFVGGSIRFTHTGSNGNAPATYQWNFGDGTANATTENMTHVYSIAGSFNVTLTIADADGDVDVEKKIGYISVVVDLLPDATFTADATWILTGDPVHFTHTGGNGNLPASYQWDFGDGTVNATTENPTHYYWIVGSFTIKLTVIDNDGDLNSYSLPTPIIVVLDHVPLADFYIVNATNTAGDAPNTYIWNFGDGTRASTINATHAWAMRGTFTINLTIIDDDGDTSTYVKTITVEFETEPPVTPPFIIPLSAGWQGLLVVGTLVVIGMLFFYFYGEKRRALGRSSRSRSRS